MAKKIVNFNYSKFRTLDIFVSHRRNVTGGIIRMATKRSIKAAFNRSIPNHAGFLFEIYGQYFALEMGPDGLEINSMEKYRTKKELILSVYRWQGFDDIHCRDDACRHVAEQARRKLEYDWGGAIVSSPWGRKLFRRMKNKKSKDFCSEHVLKTIEYAGFKNIVTHLNPLQLVYFMESQKTFPKVRDWAAWS